MADEEMDDGADLRAPQAAELSARQIVEEMERRGLKPTGFVEDDTKKLQVALDAEFEMDKAEIMRERREIAERKRAEEDALRLQRFLEKCAREEAEALHADEHAAFLTDLAANNSTPPEVVFRALPNAVRAFVKSLSTCSSLLYLDLCNCSLGDDVGAELGAVLRSNTALRVLELDYNRFGPRTATALAAALARNKTLQRLSLQGCRIVGEDASKPDLSGITALSSALAVNTSLVSLSLAGSRLGGEAGRLLAQGVVANGSLTCLSLDVVDGVAADDLAAMGDVVAANTAAHAAARAAGKAARSAARRAEIDAQKVKAAEALARAEVAWQGEEAAYRQAFRDARDEKAAKDAANAIVERAQREKDRNARMKAEAEAAAKAAKAKK